MLSLHAPRRTLIAQPPSGDRAAPIVFTTLCEPIASIFLQDEMHNVFAAYDARPGGTLLGEGGGGHHIFLQDFFSVYM